MDFACQESDEKEVLFAGSVYYSKMRHVTLLSLPSFALVLRLQIFLLLFCILDEGRQSQDAWPSQSGAS